MKKFGTSLISVVAGGIAGAAAAGNMFNKKAVQATQYAQKHLAIMQVMNQWIMNKQNGKDLKDFFLANGYKEIAIYGMSYLGERLADELSDSEITVKYAIDRNADNIYTPFELLKPDDTLPEVDAIIVTAVSFFDEIEQDLEDKVDCPIISIEDVVYGS